MSKVSIEEDTIDAAGMAFRGVESGRRVGWAKAFEALRRADSAERDVNVLRADIKILTSFAARCYGALEVAVGSPGRMNELFRGDNHELSTYLAQGPLNQGRDQMRAMIARKVTEFEQLRRDIKDKEAVMKGLRKEDQAASDARWVAAKRAVRAELMEQFGIPDDEAFFAWLSAYRPRFDN